MKKEIQSKIFEIRGHKVMLDFDLAELYEVETKNLNKAVKRNIDRFPADFMFQLSENEWENLRLQIETSNSQRFQIGTFENWKGKYSKYTPHAFTEQGLAMLSGILNSKKAIETNISIMRAFVLMRQYALTHKDLNEKLKELENKYNQQFKDVYEALNFLLKKDKLKVDQSERKKIGFKS